MPAEKPVLTPVSSTMPVFRFNFLLPRYWLTWTALFFFYLISLLPIAVLDSMGMKLGSVMARKNKKRFSIAKKNLLLCFKDKTEGEIDQLVTDHFQCYTRSLMHYGIVWWAPKWRLRKLISIEGLDRLNELRSGNNKIIALTCHTMGLEFLCLGLSMHFDCAGPYKAMRNEIINWLVARGRSRMGALVYTREEGFRPLIRAVKNDRLLIYLSDEDLGMKSAVFAPFFGVQKASVAVLGRLAKNCEADVVPCVGCYQPERRRYLVKVLPAIESYPTENDLTDTIKMNQAIEKMVTQCLSQYMWTLRLFQTRPEGEENLYP